MGVSMTGNLVAGGILGLGLLALIWSKVKEAQNEKARADSLASYMKSDSQASVTEGNLLTARDSAEHEKLDILSW